MKIVETPKIRKYPKRPTSPPERVISYPEKQPGDSGKTREVFTGSFHGKLTMLSLKIGG